MSKFLRRGFGFIAIALAAGCSAHVDEEATGSSSDELMTGPLFEGPAIPYPGPSAGNDAWTGTLGELTVADALMVCTLNSQMQPRGEWVTDSGFASVRAKMKQTVQALSTAGGPALPANGSLSKTWYTLRTNNNINFRPRSNAKQALSVTSLKFPAPYDTTGYSSFGTGGWSAGATQRALDVAAVNLCVARSVNEQMQFGWDLLMTAADQRLLLETVRERSQVAMLQIADLASSLESTDLTSTAIGAAAYGLRSFAQTGTGPGGKPASTVFTAWASDLTDAVRLQTTATEKLSKLLLRSAGAHEPLPGAAAGAISIDNMSPGSWRERIVALMYGGNPLDATSLPGAPPAVKASSKAPAQPWPTATEMPFAPASAWTPGALQFLTIAQQYDTMALKLTGASYASAKDVDVANAAKFLYLDLEGAIRTQNCTPSATSSCPTVVLPSTTTLPVTGTTPTAQGLAQLNGWSAWKKYQLRPEDAQALVTALTSVMPSVTTSEGFHVVGASDLRTLPNRTTASLHFASTARLLPRSMIEAAAIYGRFGRHHSPQVLVDSPYMDSVYMGGADGGNDGTALDGTRFMGSVPALANLRELLVGVNASTAAAEAPFKAKVAQLSAVVTAAIGDSQVAIRPVETTTTVLGTKTVTQATGAAFNGATTRQWLVRVTPSSGDAFWSDLPSTYSIYATVDAPQTMSAVADTKNVRAGFSPIGTILSNTTSAIAGSATTKDAAGGFASTVSVPESVPGSTRHAISFVVRHRGKRAIDYRVLSGLSTPWATVVTATDNTTIVPLPGDSQYYATAGAFTTMVTQATAVNPLDPSTFYYDGFGLPRTRLPNRAALTSTNSRPSMTDYVSSAINTGVNSAAVAESQNYLGGVIKEVSSLDQDVVNVAAAKARELAATNQALATLCGSMGTNAADAAVTSAATACGISFVTVDATGPMASEMLAVGCTSTAGAPGIRMTPDWPTPAAPVDCTLPDPNDQADQIACSLASQRGIFSFPVEVAQPVACAAWSRAPSFDAQTGQLAALLAAEHKAYWAYRDAVAALAQAGDALVQQARATDDARAAATASLAAEQARIAANVNQNTIALKEASIATSNALATMNEKATELADLTTVSEQSVLQGVASTAGTGSAFGGLGGAAGAGLAGAGVGGAATTGAAAGSVVPGVGTAIGAGVGVIVGGILAAMGPSQEQKDQAQDAYQQARRAYTTAQSTEADLASFYGLCNLSPQTPKSPKYGACPNAPLGTLMAQYRAEQLAAEAQAQAAGSQALTALYQGEAGFRTQLGATLGGATDLAASSIAIRNAVQTADLDVQRAQLESSLVVQTTNVDFGIMQAFWSDLLFNTAASIEQARHDLADARRALEFTYAMDMSAMSSPIGTQAAPNVWADQIYDYDLTALRAVYGSTQAASPDIDPTKLSDYARNLGALESEYLTVSNTVIAAQPITTTFVAGPMAQVTVTMTTDAGTTTEVVPDPAAGNWLVQCPAGSACAPNGGYCPGPTSGTFASVCSGGAPVSAKVRFALNAWGQVAGTQVLGNQIPLLNGRWARVAVNLTGTDVRTCVQTDPNCSVTDSVGYTIRQLGPYVVSGSDGQLHLLPFTQLQLSASALDGLGVIDVNSATGSFGLPAITNYLRPEFVGSPLGGLYEIELYPATNQDLGRIDHVQLVIDPNFWEVN